MIGRAYLKPFVLGGCMLFAVALTPLATPTVRLSEQKPKVDLETMVPETFGDWRIDPAIMPVTVSPDVQAALDKIYNQTLSRTYVNGKGERVMLSMAYGADQSDDIQVHLPEGCYAGQGFAVSGVTKGHLTTKFGDLPVARLIATKGPRSEPITYWVIVGAQPATDVWEMKKAKLGYALKGEVADGLLIRISSITSNAEHGYEVQKAFAQAMLSGLQPEDRDRLVGSVPAAS